MSTFTEKLTIPSPTEAADGLSASMEWHKRKDDIAQNIELVKDNGLIGIIRNVEAVQGQNSVKVSINKRPRGLHDMLGHLPDWNKLGLCLTAM